MESIIWLSGILILLLLAAFFSGSETALFSLSSTKLKAFATSNDSRKQLVANLMKKPRDLLVTVFMLNTLANILLQNVISAAAGPEGGWILKIALPFVLLLIFGEILPKYIGLQKNITIAQLSAPLVSFVQQMIAPLRKTIITLTLPISRALFFFLKKEASISRDEMKHVLRKSEEHGVLQSDESELVWGYLNLTDVIVKEAMRPREEVLFYDIKEPLSKLKHLLVDEQVSRIPVCDGNLQNIVGIITAEIFFLHQGSLEKENVNIRPFLMKPVYIPQSAPAKVLLRRLNALDREMALVVDEYGAITGLITYEDVVEIVIGNIEDLRDKETDYTRSSPDEIIASGKLELLIFNELFDCDLISPNNMVTIGGWLTEKYGSIPKSGIHCEYEGFSFHVLSADQTKIKRLLVRKK